MMGGQRVQPSRRTDDAASAIEFALVLPILLMLLFGMMTGGLALTEQQQVNHAAREAARFGATLGSFDSDQVAARVHNAGQGFLHEDVATVCVAFGDSDAGTFDRSWYAYDSGTDSLAATAAPSPVDDYCPDLFNGDASAGVRVQVSMRVPVRLEAVVFGKDITLGADAVAMYEE